jgi:predicted SprT family Zn-dependent metalloprotease
MIATKQEIERTFHEWNKKAFNGELPTPKFGLFRAKTVFGYYKAYPSSTISLSTFYDRPEEEFINTVVHEMLHYYIHYKKIKDTSVHGRVWKRMANDLNRRFPTLHLTRCGKRCTEINEAVINGLKGKKEIAFLCKGEDGNHYGCLVPVKKLKVFYAVYNNWAFLNSVDVIEVEANEHTLRLPRIRTRGSVRKITKQVYDSLMEQGVKVKV